MLPRRWLEMRHKEPVCNDAARLCGSLSAERVNKVQSCETHTALLTVGDISVMFGATVLAQLPGGEKKKNQLL